MLLPDWTIQNFRLLAMEFRAIQAQRHLVTEPHAASIEHELLLSMCDVLEAILNKELNR